ncbi:MAG: hypothetical protein NT001_07680 [Candidatus Woesearchaeota archaeon]|nr:hypothetical protein [Candidatus Woesearchaeota archaeon]
MLVQKQFLSKLKDFGLNTYESKLWTALLSRGVSTAGELSDIANVPRSRSYDVLESLEKKGVIIMKIGKPIKYIAVPPEEVLERVKKNVKEEAETQTNMLDEIKGSELIKELNTLHTQGIDLVEPSDLSGALKGRSSIYNHLETLIKNAKKSIIISTTEQGLIRKSDALRQAMKKASEKGVSIRIIAPITKDSEKAVKSLKGIASIRESDKSLSRFVVIDEKDIVFMLLDDTEVHPTYDTGVWVDTKYFAKTIHNFFDVEWSRLKE